ncbi:TadE/TadG family type IV pilus assembly protein [Brevibacillus dissolubilis]|uniref:TadE/TadG family type IV pilus assembly protein n=1 Tax=Brevibacillus dissolubilis TaxID=1844116 RepID=UPI001117043E|nr:TadE/TadG family type IV pilus assembly protein [Brevibacillus dissolubilis]
MPPSILKRFWREERGSQTIEFVLVFPILWFLFAFSVDQFTILYNKQKALAAAYEAGRFAATQPNFGLAKYYARLKGEKELEQAIGLQRSDIELLPDGRWRKGNHVESRVTVTFPSLATGEVHSLRESYFMMIENAGD